MLQDKEPGEAPARVGLFRHEAFRHRVTQWWLPERSSVDGASVAVVPSLLRSTRTAWERTPARTRACTFSVVGAGGLPLAAGAAHIRRARVNLCSSASRAWGRIASRISSNACLASHALAPGRYLLEAITTLAGQRSRPQRHLPDPRAFGNLHRSPPRPRRRHARPDLAWRVAGDRFP
jgi:hypothetical protein